ncbi:hypothetical protein [Tenacibaculum sp. SG-28]|uniref:hypothetical protein n=1 Tax=Tenacibaculum sp. SG-28 TaxID=754426 RepID=UPI0026D398B8
MPNTYVIYPFTKGIGFPLAEHEYIGIRKEDLTKLPFSPWKHHTDKMVILQSISFADKKGFNTHRLLRAIANNMLLSKLPESEQGSITDCLVNPKTLKEAFVAFPEIIKNTEHLLKKCTVAFDFSKNSSKNKKFYTGNAQLDYRLLRKLTYTGLAYRYAKQTKEILDRIEKELKMIQEKSFVSYFLINWKILKYARSKGYFYVGRGSGANSIVAYLLRITDVDPIELDLYFERFINMYRQNPPDFDIDFSWKDRDDVTRYIFSHFKHTALITVYNTFKYRAAIRELGKVFGLPKSEIDKLLCNSITMQP